MLSSFKRKVLLTIHDHGSIRFDQLFTLLKRASEQAKPLPTQSQSLWQRLLAKLPTNDLDSGSLDYALSALEKRNFIKDTTEGHNTPLEKRIFEITRYGATEVRRKMAK